MRRETPGGEAAMPDPQDLARWRALCEEAEQSATACSLDVKSPESFRQTLALATALRSACAEVERLREAVKPAAGDGPCCCGETTDCYYCRPR